MEMNDSESAELSGPDPPRTCPGLAPIMLWGRKPDLIRQPREFKPHLKVLRGFFHLHHSELRHPDGKLHQKGVLGSGNRPAGAALKAWDSVLKS